MRDLLYLQYGHGQLSWHPRISWQRLKHTQELSKAVHYPLTKQCVNSATKIPIFLSAESSQCLPWLRAGFLLSTLGKQMTLRIFSFPVLIPTNHLSNEKIHPGEVLALLKVWLKEDTWTRGSSRSVLLVPSSSVLCLEGFIPTVFPRLWPWECVLSPQQSWNQASFRFKTVFSLSARGHNSELIHAFPNS